MIPEWLSFQNEFHFRVKFALHSHVKIEWLSLRHSHSCGFCTRSDAYLLLAPDYMIGDFQSGTKFVFGSHDTRKKLHTRTRISVRLKTGMNSFWLEWLEWELNVISVYHVNKYREIYGDDFNMFQNENHSVSLWVVPYWLCNYPDCTATFLPGSLRMCQLSRVEWGWKVRYSFVLFVGRC